MLPTPEQTWAHSVCSEAELRSAIEDNSITAIESDIMFGTITSTDDTSTKLQPVMAHPPDKTSDLSFQTFIERLIDDTKLKKHVKLDIKEIECLEPMMDTLRDVFKSVKDNQRAVFLNADILPGPGKREDPLIKGDDFIETCMKLIEDGSGSNASFCAFSLGWRTDPRSEFGYTTDDVKAMEELIVRYSLPDRCMGVVLAVNARVLVKSLNAFDDLLEKIPSCQLLVWTGTGEPALSLQKLQKIKEHFEWTNLADRVGYDCKVATYEFEGSVMDAAVDISGMWYNWKNPFA